MAGRCRQHAEHAACVRRAAPPFMLLRREVCGLPLPALFALLLLYLHEPAPAAGGGMRRVRHGGRAPPRSAQGHPPVQRIPLALRGGGSEEEQHISGDDLEAMRKEVEKLSAEMPHVELGPHYPGIDTERAGILPEKVQTIKKDIMDADVDDMRLDDSVLCDAQDYFNTSATPVRSAKDVVPEETHFPPSDPNAFKNLSPVEIDPTDLEFEGFDYNFDDSSEAAKGRRRAPPVHEHVTPASRIGAPKPRQNLTAQDEESIREAKDKIRVGLEDLPPDARSAMISYLNDLGWKMEEEVVVPRKLPVEPQAGQGVAGVQQGVAGSGAAKTYSLSAFAKGGLTEEDMGQDVGISHASRELVAGMQEEEEVMGQPPKSEQEPLPPREASHESAELNGQGKTGGKHDELEGEKMRMHGFDVVRMPWKNDTDDGEWVGGWKARYGARDSASEERTESSDSTEDSQDNDGEGAGREDRVRHAEAGLESRLYAYYGHVNVSKVHDVTRIAEVFVNDLASLDRMLQLKYGQSLSQFEEMARREDADTPADGTIAGTGHGREMEGSGTGHAVTTNMLKDLARESSLVGAAGGRRGGESNEAEMRQIHEENMKRLHQLSPEERAQARADLHQVLDPRTVKLLEMRAIKRREAAEGKVSRELEAENEEALSGRSDVELPARLRDLPEEFRKPKDSVWSLLASGGGPWVHREETDDFAQGRQLVREQQVEQLRLYQSVLRLRPYDAVTMRSMARFHRDVDGDKSRALETFAKSLALEPHSADALSEYGELLHASDRKGDLGGLVPGGGVFEVGWGVDGGAGKQAAGAGGMGDHVAVVGTLQDAQAFYEAALKLEPGHVPTLVRYGMLSEANDDQSAAVGMLVQALEHEPAHAPALSGLGYLYQRRGNITGAHACYTQALSMDPANVDTLTNAAALLHSSGRQISGVEDAMSQAEALFERAVLLAPLHVRALYNFGLFQESVRHDYNKAELLFRSAVARCPTHSGALTQLAQLLMEDGRDLVGAEDLLEQALASDPHHLDALCQRARLLQQDKDELGEAEAVYAKVLSLSPDYLPALNSMASLYLAKGDEEAVNKVVMKALQVAPDDADTVLNGAALMWETEFSRKQGAERDASVSGKLIERALALDPSHVGALCLEGMWHFKGMGDLQRGLDCLERAAAIDPSSEVARNGLLWIQTERQKLAYLQGSEDPFKGTQKLPGRLQQGVQAAGAPPKLGNAGAAGREFDQEGMRAARERLGSRADENGTLNGHPATEVGTGTVLEDSEPEVEGPHRGAYYETVSDLHALPDDIPAGTAVGGEGTFGLY